MKSSRSKSSVLSAETKQTDILPVCAYAEVTDPTELSWVIAKLQNYGGGITLNLMSYTT